MKNKKTLFFSLALASLLIGGCSRVPVETKDTVFITFKDYDDSVLFHTRIPYGSIGYYEGDDPSREMTDKTIYKFTGWDKQYNEPIYENTIFTATYKEETRKYVVTFKNYDGTTLRTDNVEYGSTAMYTSENPVKPSDDEHIEYTFSGWDKNLDTTTITKDTVFTAQFSESQFVIATFNNYDGSPLYRDKVKKGAVPTYGGRTPTRPYAGTDKAYRFLSWDRVLTSINSDTVYTAVFELLNYYTVTFKNYDGTVLQTVKVLEGESATYTGDSPYRYSTTSGDYLTTYFFSGWSSSTDNVTCDMEVTAEFSSNTRAIGATAIRNHLDRNGTGTYKNVETAYVSDGHCTLGYSGSYFYMGYTNTTSMESYMAISCLYGASSGTGAYQLTNNGITMFSATYTIYFANHAFDSLTCTQIKINRYSTDSELAAVAALTLLAARYAVDNASQYLSDNGLSYIF